MPCTSSIRPFMSFSALFPSCSRELLLLKRHREHLMRISLALLWSEIVYHPFHKYFNRHLPHKG